MRNTEQLLPQTEKQLPEVFYENAVPKIFAIFTGKHLYEIFMNIYLKEHLCRAASELTLRNIAWNLVSRLRLNPSRLSDITKIPVAFKSEL